MAQNVFYRDFSMLKAGILSAAMVAALVLSASFPAQQTVAAEQDGPRYVLIRATVWIDGDCPKDAQAPVDL
ncbi:MAG: hypothetical protein QNJ09_04010 [Paracoccaceae bacterium]|nr:hypothetical protein [Paracoccaceae bacterium]